MRQPIITCSGNPAEIISLDIIKEYLGLHGDIDAEQDQVLSVVRKTAIEQGEHITGIKWAAAAYTIEGLRGRDDDLLLPVAPATAVERVMRNGEVIDPSLYRFIPSAVDMGRPWGILRSASRWSGEYAITCTVGWTEETLPESLRGWGLIRIASLYDYREDLVTGTITSAMPRHHADGLLDRWRVYGVPHV